VLVNKQVFAQPGHWRWLLPYRDPRRDDIIVFHYPIDPTQLLVKRVIAVPADRVHLHGGGVVLNGAPLSEPFTVYAPAERSAYRDEFPNLQRADPAAEATWWIELRHRIRAGDLPVPDSRYFAMGDNRNNSQDSRFWGFVTREEIIGAPLVVYLSAERTADSPRGRVRWSRIGHILH
jgi:signal peptidase I